MCEVRFILLSLLFVPICWFSFFQLFLWTSTHTHTHKYTSYADNSSLRVLSFAFSHTLVDCPFVCTLAVWWWLINSLDTLSICVYVCLHVFAFYCSNFVAFVDVLADIIVVFVCECVCTLLCGFSFTALRLIGMCVCVSVLLNYIVENPM